VSREFVDGDSDPIIAACKRRLNVFPDTDEYTQEFAQKLRGFQKVHGLYPDGILTDSIIEKLGVSSDEND